MLLAPYGVISTGNNLPTSVAGLYAWLDASQITGTFNLESINIWLDMSGNGRNGLQATPGLYPQYHVSGGSNSKPCVIFAGGDCFNFSGWTTPTAAELFLVIKNDLDIPAATQATWGIIAGTTNTPHYRFTNGVIYESFGSTLRSDCGSSAGALNVWNLYNVRSASGSYVCNLNGTDFYTSASNTVGWTATPILGAGTGGAFCNARISELIIYGSVLSDADRTRIKSYLANKYALTLA